MIDRKQLILQGMQAAMRVRTNQGIACNAAICVYDFAERMNVDVRFEKLPSMEGFYLNQQPPVIVISSMRPSGRRRFTCGHELGHHTFGHGSQYDELLGERPASRRRNPTEIVADAFAGALLMPKSAVAHGFQSRGWEISAPSAAQVFEVATWLGVGFNTLLTQMELNYRMISRSIAAALAKNRPVEIRSQIVGERCTSNLFLVNSHWADRAVDMEVGDRLLVPAGYQFEGRSLVEPNVTAGHSLLFQATEPGIGRVFDSRSSWAAYLRVSPSEFAGLSVFRFEQGELE